ncbi:RNA methyltransferase [Chakrabartyella piscis]|uniref:TrmH family RNA methyltransferase n=1 Tax=Chakrabartyella piscis TaxID=2918914 RepID=UPI0029586749|nr:RNA methyltransferase [Chakrabartyella piscis]
MAKYIESPQNKIYKRLKGLQLKKNRDKEGLFLAEGLRFVSEIPDTWTVDFIACSQTFSKEMDTIDFETRWNLIVFPDDLFEDLCDTESPQGVLAVCAKRQDTIATLPTKENYFFILAEELNDPGNLGTIIRTADACGADGVFLSKGSVDVYNPKVLRSTMGSLFHLPIFQNVDLSETATILQEKGVSLYAAHLQGTDYPYTLPLTKSCGFLIGNEARGLSDAVANLCNQFVKIPMPGQAESLNASIAAGVLMYEVVRQRLK